MASFFRQMGLEMSREEKLDYLERETPRHELIDQSEAYALLEALRQIEQIES